MAPSPTKKVKTSEPELETRHFINNEFVESVSKKRFPTVNPATEKVIVEVCEAQEEDVNLAVAAAKKAFALNSPWRQTSPPARRDLLLKLASLIERDREELALVESMDNGKPIGELGTTYGSIADFYLVVQCECD